MADYRASLIKTASLGAGYEPAVQRNLDYIKSALAQQGLYREMLTAINAGYIVPFPPSEDAAAEDATRKRDHAAAETFADKTGQPLGG